MFSEAQVFLAGYVAREPKFRTTVNGISTVSMRVGYTPRRMDRETGEWTDGVTSFVSVVCWRTLADHVAMCLHKGEPVLVKGKLQVRPYEKDGVERLAVEIDASSIGHDLARGVANFQRTRRPAERPAGSPDGSPFTPASGSFGSAGPFTASPEPASADQADSGEQPAELLDGDAVAEFIGAGAGGTASLNAPF